jgi:hypothetical protein
MALLSEDREKASEARQFTKSAKNPFGQNNFSFLRQPHSYNLPHATNCLGSAQCFTT